ncbi:MAG: DNA internalization-related competence protein ComEC/Rec2 [Chloroflexi bacterium]|nr:DNA internalization-related competence protein ComEC/Rec2 [Chloroflexota bacterium]
MTAIVLGSAWLIGIYLGSLVSLTPEASVISGSMAGLVAILVRREPALRLGLFCVAALLIGSVRYQLAIPTVDDAALQYYNGQGTVQVRGVVNSDPELRDKRLSVVVEAEQASIDGQWRDLKGSMLVYLPRLSHLAYGDTLELTGRLESPPVFDDFDYRGYLARQGIHSTMAYPRVRVLGNQGVAPLSWIYAFRKRLSQALDTALTEPQASLAKGILLGIRTSMPQPLLDAFSRTNTTHILAISGWNISLVVSFLCLVGGKLLGRRQMLAFAVGGILLYTTLIGPQPSVVRAAIMGTLLVAASYLGRPSDAIAWLAIAATGMTALNPLLLWDVGFQLSFVATAGLALLAPTFQSRLSFLPTWLNESLSATFAAQLATVPVLASTFGQFSPVTFVANLLVMPAMLPIMLLSALASVVGLIWTPLGYLPASLDWLFLSYMIGVVEYTASLPLASIAIAGFSFVLFVPYYAALAFLFLALRPLPISAPRPQNLTRAVPFGRVILVLALLVALAWATVFTMPRDELRISFIDVDQGDAILIETPSRQRILVDGGPGASAVMSYVGRRVPYWDRSIDLVALTHANEDHLAGLVEVLERMEVRQVLEPGLPSNSLTYRRWLELIRVKNIRTTKARAGQEVDLGQGIKLQVLHPSPQTVRDIETDLNANSVVLRLVAGATSLLLTGDANETAQRELLGSGQELASTILKVPHHGSRDGLIDSFLTAVDPRAAVISVGKNNTFRHPAPETLAKLKDVRVYRTDENGSVEVTVRSEGYTVETER